MHLLFVFQASKDIVQSSVGWENLTKDGGCWRKFSAAFGRRKDGAKYALLSTRDEHQDVEVSGAKGSGHVKNYGMVYGSI